MGAVRKPQYVSSRTDLDWRVAKEHKKFAGFIFFCNNSTIADLDRHVFGLPAKFENTVRDIRKGMPLFLFNYSNRYLHGVFEAASDGGFNIDPHAWEISRRYGHPVSRYPAQVRVRIREERPGLKEELFRPILDHVDGSRFKLELTARQVQQLVRLFESSLTLERELPICKNGQNRPIASLRFRDPESPRSTYKSDSEYYSDCSSRGMNSGEDDWPDESLGDKLHYHQEDEEGQLSGRLSHASLSDSQAYENGHYGSPCMLEDELSVCSYDVEDATWKESFERTSHSSVSDYDSQVVLRLHENDPAVNSGSNNCMQNNVDHPILVNSSDNVLAMPMLPSQMQFPFLANENMILVPLQTVQCQQRESASYFGQSEGKWNNQRRFSRGSSINSQKQSFNQHRFKDLRYQKQHVVSDTQQSAHLQPQNLQMNPVLVSFCTQGPGQGEDPGHVANVLSPMFVPSNGAVAFAQLQAGGRVDESSQCYDAANDVQMLPERWQGQIWLMPSIIPGPSSVHSTSSQNNGFFATLHLEILDFARWTRPSTDIQHHVEAAIDCVRRGVKMVWPEADVEVFGSFATGLCLQHSDVDLAVVDAPRLPGTESLTIAQVSATLIRELAAGLKTYEWCESINPLDTASMPVLKCLCRPFGASFSTTPAIAVDITIGGTRNSYPSSPTTRGIETADQVPRPGKIISRHTGGAAREYVLQKIRELPALAPLVLLLKAFLHHKGLSNVYTGGLGSFSLTLLVAFFLELVGPKEGSADGRANDLPTPRISPSLSCSSEGSADGRANDLPTPPISPSLSCSSEFSDDSDAPSSSSSFGATTSNSTSECGGQSLGEFFVQRAAGTVERVLSFWDQTDSRQLGPLLVGFLHSFGYRDLSCEKIVLKGTDGSPGGFVERDDRHVALWIDDPLRPGVNIGAGSFCMVHVQIAFKEMLQVLRCPDALMSMQCEDEGCQDLAVMGHLSNLRRLIGAAEEIQ